MIVFLEYIIQKGENLLYLIKYCHFVLVDSLSGVKTVCQKDEGKHSVWW